MKIYYRVVGKNIELFLGDSKQPIAKVRVGESLDAIAQKLEALRPVQDESSLESATKSVFNNKGTPRLVTLYGNYWALKFDVPVRVRASRFDLEATVGYLALRLCLHYNLPEDGVTAQVIKHSLRSMFYAKFGGKL